MYGKLFGAIIGGILGLAAGSWIVGAVLALVGAYFGDRFDALSAPPEEVDAPLPSPAYPGAARATTAPDPDPDRDPDGESAARAHFARHLCALFAEVARADGDVVRDEVRVVRVFFEQDLRFPPEEVGVVRDSLKAALAGPEDLERSLAACRAELGASERLLLLDALYELALVDGHLHRSEGEAIKRIAEGLSISEADRRTIAAIHLGNDAPAYERLGVAPDAPDDELRRAYRRLAASHHPDRVAHLGPGAVEVATRRFREINEAWEQVRKVRGL